MNKVTKRVVAVVIAILIFVPTITMLIDAQIGSNPDTLLVSNIVIFAHFNDATAEDVEEFESLTYADKVKEMYDNGTPQSFSGYIDAISYGQMQVRNSFPQDTGNGIDSLELPISKTDTEYSYMGSSIIDFVAANVDFSDENLPYGLDLNNNNVLDYITVILLERGDVYQDVHPTIWPHQTNYKGNSKIAGLAISNMNILNTKRLDSLYDGGAGLIAHEYLHGFGYEDLYTNNDAYSPVHEWDIMSRASSRMQYPLAYTRYKYSNWITIDEITETEQNLRLDIQSNADGNQAFIIKSPLNNYEFFVVEYRVKGEPHATDETFLDSEIPGSGLIIYRVDTTVTGSKNSAGETHIYVFRDGADKLVSIDESFFTTGDSFGSADMSMGLLDNALTYNDGRNSGVVIDNIEVAPGGSSITFDVTIPVASDFDLWEDTGYQNTGVSDDLRSVTSLSHNDILYTLEGLSAGGAGGNDRFILKSFDGEQYKTLVNLDVPNALLSATSLFAANGKLYFGYIEEKNNYATDVVVKEYTIATNSWSSGDYLRVADSGYNNAFDIYADDENIYIYYLRVEENDNLYLSVTDFATKTTNVYKNESVNESTNTVGTLKLVSNKGILHTFYRTDRIKGYTFVNGVYTELSTGNVSANSFDLISYNEKIYFITYDWNAPSSFYRYDETGMQQINMSVGDLSQSKIDVSEGNFYMVGLNEENQVVAYKFDDNLKDFVLEGEVIDKAINGSSFEINAIGNSLYVSYLNSSKNIVVKNKTAADKLISITANVPPRLVYKVGDDIDYDIISITANYTNGTKVLQAGEYQFENFNTASSGERIATVTFYGKETYFHYLVEETTDIGYKKGDIDKSGDINLQDFEVLMNYIKTNQEFDSFNDLNEDGMINVIDAQALYEQIEAAK